MLISIWILRVVVSVVFHMIEDSQCRLGLLREEVEEEIDPLEWKVFWKNLQLWKEKVF